jgi:hypothetical protein
MSTARQIVEGVLSKQPEAHVELYVGLKKFCWSIFREHLSEDDSWDFLQDLYLKVRKAIEGHKIEHPEFVFTYAQRTALSMLGEKKLVQEKRMAA